ncbi:hypothetical protein EZ456_04115 [Pedobacter psychrodurus]|uniref:Uncharacterized protein n=1 Tax=Pedobacter psychrodurus TaxID=2530456 RepID=A0A4R0Q2K7_9SPHI|nr:hypothetical protein [Pedobacter psychrodurus]TCD28583.1 hypothetical protein EZ456_04115 [Pedobacter psychrodurus]
MSITSSNLGSSVNFTVATTLEAINATMFEYLSGTDLPLISLCWTQSGANQPYVLISLEDLMNQAAPGGTNGTNPFNVPGWISGDPVTADITNMQQSHFVCGIQIQLGIPPGMAMPGAQNPNNLPVLPPILAINSSNTNTAIFTLLCQQFQVVYPTWGFQGSYAFNNEHQPVQTVWAIILNVPLSSITVPPNGNNVPSNVTNQINDFGPDMFSIQQLFLDFSSAVFTTVPTFTNNFPAGVSNQITPAMVQELFENDINQGLSVLGYTITQNNPNLEPSTLTVGSLTLVFDEYNPASASTMGLSTLNYLCNQGTTAPPQNYSGIKWNWIDSGGDGAQYDGAVAISNDVFTPYFASLLAPFVQANCNVPVMALNYSGLDMYYNYYLVPGTAPAYTVGSGGNIINYSFNSGMVEASCGHHGLLTYYEFKSYITYTMAVTVSGNELTIVQQLVVFASVKYESSLTEWSGNYIDTTYTDVYQLNAGEGGALVFSSPAQTVAVNGQQPPSSGVANFMLGIKKMTDLINERVQFASTEITDVPATSIGTFVFPGGQTFSFADAQFSDSNDLVAYITYNDPLNA